MAPNRGHDGVEGVSLETCMRHAEVPALHQEGESALLHVEDHVEGVGNEEGFFLAAGLRGQDGVRAGLGVVQTFVPAQVPAPGILVAADQALVTR